MLETGKQNINLNLLGGKGQLNNMFFFYQITQLDLLVYINMPFYINLNLLAGKGEI